MDGEEKSAVVAAEEQARVTLEALDEETRQWEAWDDEQEGDGAQDDEEDNGAWAGEEDEEWPDIDPDEWPDIDPDIPQQAYDVALDDYKAGLTKKAKWLFAMAASMDAVAATGAAAEVATDAAAGRTPSRRGDKPIVDPPEFGERIND